MIVIASFFCIFVILLMRHNRLSIAELSGYSWLFLVWLATFASHIFRDFVQTDEIYFASGEATVALANRGLWIALNYLMSMTTADIVSHMRILNLFFLFILYTFAVRIFRSMHPTAIAFILSYFACVAALNLRDTLVFVSLLMLLSRIDLIMNSGGAYNRLDTKLALPGLLMFLLRPFQLAIVLISSLRWYYFIVVILLSVALLQSELGSQYFYNWSWHFQNFEQSVLDRGADKVDDPRPTPANIMSWTARFLFAPVPWTSIARIALDDTYEYGRIDLAVRAFHRIFLYSMFIYLGYQLARRPRMLFILFDRYSFVIKFIVIFSLIYAVFNFGGSHERIKMNVFLAMLFIIDRMRSIYSTALVDRYKYAT